MNAIFDLINPTNTITVNRMLAHSLGLMEAVVYAALVSKCYYYEQNEMLTEDGWFYSTIADLEESTTLSDKQQKRCIDNLAAAGLIVCKQRGLPAKRYFKVIEDIELLTTLLNIGVDKALGLNPKANEGRSDCFPKVNESIADSSPETAEQEPPKADNKNLPNSETCSPESAEHTIKSNINNHNLNQSINRDGIDRTDISRSDYLSVIRSNIDYEAISDKSQVDELIEIMLDVICSNKPTVRVNGDELSSEVVKSRFMKLDGAHIEYVLIAMKKSPSEIRNIRAYLITALYNAPATMESYYAAWVNYDLNGRG